MTALEKFELNCLMPPVITAQEARELTESYIELRNKVYNDIISASISGKRSIFVDWFNVSAEVEESFTKELTENGYKVSNTRRSNRGKSISW